MMMCNNVLNHAMLYYVILYHTISHNVISLYIILYYTVTHTVTLCTLGPYVDLVDPLGAGVELFLRLKLCTGVPVRTCRKEKNWDIN